jgi:hypothetical protein
MRTKPLAVAAALILGTAPNASANGWTAYYGYGDRLSNGTAGDIRNATPPPESLRPHIVCRETVTVPSQDGGTRQITILRC